MSECNADSGQDLTPLGSDFALSSMSSWSKVDIHQVISNQLPSPYTSREFWKFLKVDCCEENLEFLTDIISYRDLAGAVFVLTTDGSTPTYGRILSKYLGRSDTQSTSPTYSFNETSSLASTRSSNFEPKIWTSPISFDKLEACMVDLQQTMAAIRIRITKIVQMYLAPSSQKEIYLPVGIKKHILSEFRASNFHPDIFKDAYDHIIDMLQTRPFTKFLAAAAKISNRSDIFNYSLNNSSDGAYSHKITIQQVIANSLSEPHTNKDFLEFLKFEHCEENLQFLNDIISYKILSKAVYHNQTEPNPSHSRIAAVLARPSFPGSSPPDSADNSRDLDRRLSVSMASSAVKAETVDFDEIESVILAMNSRELGGSVNVANRSDFFRIPQEFTHKEILDILRDIRSSIHAIFATYMSSDSPKEVNLPSAVKKRAHLEFSARNFHPDILNEPYEHILNILRIQPFVKFLACASKNPGRKEGHSILTRHISHESLILSHHASPNISSSSEAHTDDQKRGSKTTIRQAFLKAISVQQRSSGNMESN
ncbi:hypothetical protein BASA61_007754 [Batrachochytrium salamandrivorans]|nr:hypothetical protein BASA61_007754 [Batrachochytrium salamandrivorans]